MWILGRIKLYLAITGAILVAFIGAYLRGRADAVIQKDKERADEYIKTRKSIDQAPDAISDAGGAREWLLERHRQRGGDL